MAALCRPSPASRTYYQFAQCEGLRLRSVLLVNPPESTGSITPQVNMASPVVKLLLINVSFRGKNLYEI